jgi:hypothetical protein
MFTNCGHLACMKCQTALDFCSVCKLPASVLPIAHLGQQAPHLQHLFKPIWPEWDQLKQAAEVTHFFVYGSRHSFLKSCLSSFNPSIKSGLSSSYYQKTTRISCKWPGLLAKSGEDSLRARESLEPRLSNPRLTC